MKLKPIDRRKFCDGTDYWVLIPDPVQEVHGLVVGMYSLVDNIVYNNAMCVKWAIL